MTMRTDVPSDLRSGPVRLVFDRVVTPPPRGGLVPFYHFRILNEADEDVGHINFRVGDTRHVILYAGHVGYAIREEYRGRGFAYHACRALASFVREHYDRVIVTADPANKPSLRVIAKLGAVFLDEVDVPADDPAHAAGARRKRRYAWTP